MVVPGHRHAIRRERQPRRQRLESGRERRRGGRGPASVVEPPKTDTFNGQAFEVEQGRNQGTPTEPTLHGIDGKRRRRRSLQAGVSPDPPDLKAAEDELAAQKRSLDATRGYRPSE